MDVLSARQTLPPGWTEQYDSRRDLWFYICNSLPQAPFATTIHPAEARDAKMTTRSCHNLNRHSLAVPPSATTRPKNLWRKPSLSFGFLSQPFKRRPKIADYSRDSDIPSFTHAGDAIGLASKVPALSIISFNRQSTASSSSARAMIPVFKQERIEMPSSADTIPPVPDLSPDESSAASNGTSGREYEVSRSNSSAASRREYEIHPGDSEAFDGEDETSYRPMSSLSEIPRFGSDHQVSPLSSSSSSPHEADETSSIDWPMSLNAEPLPYTSRPATATDNSAYTTELSRSPSPIASLEDFGRICESPVPLKARSPTSSHSSIPPASPPSQSQTSPETPFSADRSEISRGKRPIRQKSPPSTDSDHTRDDNWCQISNQGNNNVPMSIFGTSFINPEVDSSRQPRVSACLATSDFHVQLEKPVARLKLQNELFIAQSMEMRTRIDMLQAGIRLLSSKQQQAQASLIDRSSSSRLQTSTTCSSRPSSPRLIRSASIHSISPVTSRVYTGSADCRESRLRSCSEPGLDNNHSGDDEASYPYAGTAMKETVAKFVGAARELRFMMEIQASWLADRMDAQGSMTSEHTSENRDDEVTGSVVQALFRCGICLEGRPEDDFVRIDGCKHELCRTCLRSYISSQLKEHRYPMFCPTCKADQATNDDPQMISPEVVQHVGIPEHDLAVLEELQISVYAVIWRCHECMQSMFVDKYDYLSCDVTACPAPNCNRLWCKPCGQEIHGNVPHSCDGSFELDELMKEKGWKYCPGCASPIQKESGCNHLICITPGCNTHFCYLCGDKIVQSSRIREIEESVQAHYRRCMMFEAEDSDSDGDINDDESEEDEADEDVNGTDSDELDRDSWTGSDDYIDNGRGFEYSSLVTRTALASQQRRGYIMGSLID